MGHILIPVVFGVDLAVVYFDLFYFFLVLLVSAGKDCGSVDVANLAIATYLDLALVVHRS